MADVESDMFVCLNARLGTFSMLLLREKAYRSHVLF